MFHGLFLLSFSTRGAAKQRTVKGTEIHPKTNSQRGKKKVNKILKRNKNHTSQANITYEVWAIYCRDLIQKPALGRPTFFESAKGTFGILIKHRGGRSHEMAAIGGRTGHKMAAGVYSH